MITIPKGSRIRITMDSYVGKGVYEGTVIGANNYGTPDEPEWFVEFDAEIAPFLSSTGYCYWKSREHPGIIEVLAEPPNVGSFGELSRVFTDDEVMILLAYANEMLQTVYDLNELSAILGRPAVEAEQLCDRLRKFSEDGGAA